MLSWIAVMALFAGLRTVNACSPGDGGGGEGEGVSNSDPRPTVELPMSPIHATVLYITSNPCKLITGPGGMTIQLVPGPMLSLPNMNFQGISRSLVCQLPASANSSSSSGITEASTTEMPTTNEPTATAISSSSVWTTMTTFIGYTTPSYVATTPIFSHLGEGPVMFVLDNLRRTIFAGSTLNLQFLTHLNIPDYVDPMGITVNIAGFRVFWTDLMTSRILGSTLYGEHPRIYSLGFYKEPVSISFVESSGMMYIAYSQLNRITQLRFGYPNCERDLIRNTPNPRALAKSGRFLYWSRDGGIERINLVSSWRQTIYENSSLTNITGLAVDSKGSTTIIAFLDTVNHRTFYIDLKDPDNVVELTSSFSPTDFLFVTQMSVYLGDMFWTKSGDDAGLGPGVYSMRNFTSSRDLQFTAVDLFDYPVGIFIGQF